MGTISSLSFFRNEAPSPQGFDIGAIVRVGGAILKGALKGAAGIPTTTALATLPGPGAVGPIVGTALRGALAIKGRLMELGFPEWQANLLVAATPAGIGILLAQWAVPANIRVIAEPLLAKLKTGGGGGRRRRMNPLNLKALTRADRRLTQFAGIARRYVAPAAPQRQVRAFKKKSRR